MMLGSLAVSGFAMLFAGIQPAIWRSLGRETARPSAGVIALSAIVCHVLAFSCISIPIYVLLTWRAKIDAGRSQHSGDMRQPLSDELELPASAPETVEHVSRELELQQYSAPVDADLEAASQTTEALQDTSR
jgi:hypothetical protein